MDLSKNVFTTFEAAKICSANITSIKNWIDKGELEAFRTPGGHYRIKRESLSGFLERHTMPNPLKADEKFRVVAIHSEPEMVSGIAERLEDIDMSVTTDPIDGLVKAGHYRAQAVILDASLNTIPTSKICQKLTESDEMDGVNIVVVGVDDDDHADELRSAGAHRVTKSNPLDILKALLEVLTA